MKRKGVGIVGTTGKKKRKYKSIVYLLKRLLPYMYQSSKVMFLVNYVAAFMDGVLGALVIVYLQKLFTVVLRLYSHETNYSLMLQYVFIFLLIKVGNEIFNGVYNTLGEILATKAEQYLGDKINKKCSKLELIQFQESTVLDQITKSYEGAAIGRNFTNTFLTMLFLYVPYYVILGIYMFRLKPILLLIFVFLFLPEIASQIIKSKIYCDMEDEIAPYKRRCTTYSSYITGKDSFIETRVSGAFPFFRKKLEESMKCFNTVSLHSFKKAYRINALMQSLTLFGYIAVIILLFDQLAKGNIDISMFGGIFCSIDSIYEATEDMINETINYSMELRGKIENFLRFLDLPEKKKASVVLQKHGDIEIKNVSFQYPNTNQYAIKDLTCTIYAGETVAIVGENGSGKSTLAKLLIGLYSPKNGTINHNGINIEECTKESLYNNTSAVFQNFGKYKLSLKDNILLSDYQQEFEKKEEGITEEDTEEHNREMKEKLKEENKEENMEWKNKKNTEENIEKLLAKVDLKMNTKSFPDGINTVLSKEFGGVDLSGGQWQRIAIARGMNRHHELILLDEPTSAIDAIEEKHIYNYFMKLCKGKTAILITHRLASVKMVDRILVMSQGKIIGVGNHEELLDSCAEYRNMWNAQAGQYNG
ncbi:ABC transporter ATP-binding protein [Anaerosporobacter faecicola]|uniref:ABC transporter ATP-binding protein n=1 Tax=Anaerosporobacter faecicola TaxID=2718714 RepID=UPI00143A9EA7|nr:ABC transporter ATP-binding protein [Anaerosporobacter faecicola]